MVKITICKAPEHDDIYLNQSVEQDIIEYNYCYEWKEDLLEDIFNKGYGLKLNIHTYNQIIITLKSMYDNFNEIEFFDKLIKLADTIKLPDLNN